MSTHAQTDTPLPVDSAAADHNSRQRPLWELGAGVAGIRLPDYRGSDKTHSDVLPLPFVIYRGKFLRADRDGARAVLLDRERLQVDVSVAGSVPTRSNGITARQGMPNLPGTFEIGPNANVTLFGSVEDKLKLDLPAAAWRGLGAAVAGMAGRDLFAEPRHRYRPRRGRLERRASSSSSLRTPVSPRPGRGRRSPRPAPAA